MGLCGCNLKEKFVCSNGIPKGTIWHWIRISRSGDKQKICRIVEMKIRGNILCSKRTWRPVLSMERIPSRHGQDWCNWHLPGAREFGKKCAMTAKKCTRKRDTKAWGRSEIFQTWYLEKWISNHEDWTRLILISTPYEFLVLQQTLTPFRKLRLNFFCYVLTLTR